ncbi:hypothetical protein [Brevundimonas sp.]|uniref:hypothetical protein n=1 Tax=Brevundimonas sp. TaxID=1871086 RepID=UPI0035B333B7
MAAAPARRTLLRTTAALGVAGAVALAPASLPAQSGGGPVEVRVGTNPDFTRVEFAGSVGSRAAVRREGRTVVVRVGATAAPDVAELKINPPAGVTAVATRAAPGGTEVVFILAEGADARSGRADGAVYLNLYATAADAPDAGARPAAVTVAADASADRVSLDFDWDRPVGAAVFRRGEAVWIVFDAAAPAALPSGASLGPVTDAKVTRGEDWTAVRLAAPKTLAVAASAEGGRWRVTLAPTAPAASGVRLVRDDESGPTALVAQMSGAGRAVWLTDPVIGDRFAAVTALGPAKGLGAGRRTVDMVLLPTAQGLAVQAVADDLTVSADGDLVRLGRPRGLTLSAPSAALETAEAPTDTPRRAALPALILTDWSALPAGGFTARHDALQAAAAEETMQAREDPRAPIEARLALARFLVGSGLGYEAIGVLTALIEDSPAMAGEAEVRGLRGAARVAIGRLAEAETDFANASLSGDPSAKVWQGHIAAQQGDWAAARQAFAAGARAVDQFPAAWRARFAASHALAALETGDLAATHSLLAYAFAQDAPAPDQLAARLVQARLFELEGQGDRALAVFTAVARAPLDGIATPAKLGQTRLELARNAIKPEEAAARLEPLRWRWRGDATELAVIRTLGDIYLSQGRYREALEALRGAGRRLPDLPEAVELQNDLAAAFRALFLEGGVDGLEPVQALALFYDFRELTPVGAEGDDMVRRLARRLIDVDLLTPAAELLQHQVDNRLDGVAKAQVATDLAGVYLMNRQPEQALQTIWATRTTLLPTALNSERRALEARALADLGRFDHALELLEADNSTAATAVRADVRWRRQDWAEAAALYERLLAGREGGALTPEEESRLIRAGVGYTLARDPSGVARLSGRYGDLIEGARSAPALRIALDTGGEVSVADLQQVTARADTFTGWVAAQKAAWREKTGASAEPGRSSDTRQAAAETSAAA